MSHLHFYDKILSVGVIVFRVGAAAQAVGSAHLACMKTSIQSPTPAKPGVVVRRQEEQKFKIVRDYLLRDGFELDR